MRKFFIIIFSVFVIVAFAQPNLDSLINKIKTTTSDTGKLDLYLKLAETHPDEREWQKYNEFAHDLATKLVQSSDNRISRKAGRALSSTLNNKGYIEINKNNFLAALDFFERSLELKKQNDLGLAENYINIGAVMDKMGKLEKALEYYLIALNQKETQQSPMLKATIYGNIGNVYNTLGKPEKALAYFKEDLKLNNQINHLPGIGKTSSNIAVIYSRLKNYPEAFKNAYRAVAVAKKIKDIELESIAYSRLSDFYSDINYFDSSLYYSEKCIALSKITGDYINIAAEFSNQGFICLQKKEYKNAEPLLLRSYNIYDSINSLYGKKPVSLLLSSTYDSIKDYKQSLFFYKINSSIKDSLFKDENKSALIKQGIQMEFDKKEAIIKEQQDKERIISTEKAQQQKIIIWSVSCGSILVIVFSIFIYTRLQVTRRQKVLIENQKNEVEGQKNIIAEQKRIVDERQKEVLDSINYAQRIQSAVLTGEEVWNKISREHFIIFKPRDIVSGDFYWAHVLSNGRAVFALADCTGHGVPGGFMSMLGNSFLNELVVENKLFKADEILNRLRDKVIAALFQKGRSVQNDGMDIALCVWNKMDNTIEFSGANNSLYLVRDGNLIEYKGDKMPIGTYFEENKKFTSQKIPLLLNDLVYLSTDGFADQFGGDSGKKFKSKQLKQLLINASKRSVPDQKNQISETFFSWKKNHEQTDDVSLIGIKVV